MASYLNITIYLSSTIIRVRSNELRVDINLVSEEQKLTLTINRGNEGEI